MSKVYSNLSQQSESNIEPLQRQSFKIKDTSKIINILRDSLYKHKERTLVQEYICNARDAVREKYKLELIKADPKLDPKLYTGNDRSLAERELRKKIDGKFKSSDIKVTIPSELNPFFKVRDYGVGLSPERVADVFTYYCESTKGDSDIETGGFGIGGKSAWAYTDHFTVISFYEGKRYTYTSHTEKQEGELALDDISDTNEPNGVEIVVGVQNKDIVTFKNAILRICYFWNPRPTITGLTAADLPVWFDEAPVVTCGSWRLFSGNWSEQVVSDRVFNDDPTSFIFILDGVPYSEALPQNLNEELNSVFNHQIRNGKRLIVSYNAELASVDIVASREHLAKTKKTLAVLNQLSIKNELKKHYQELDNKVSSMNERSQLFFKYHTLLGSEFLSANLFPAKQPKIYDAKPFSYHFDVFYNPSLNIKAPEEYSIFKIMVRQDINDKPVVSVGDKQKEGNFKISNQESLPILVQDEVLSSSNRRLKLIDFSRKTKSSSFLLIEPSDLNSKSLIISAQNIFNSKLTSDFELAQTQRQEIKRAVGVYTLHKITFFYGRYSKDKIQQPPEFFDSIKNPMILTTEEEFKSFSQQEKDIIKNLQKLNVGIELYIGAPSTLEKLKGKNNIYSLKTLLPKLSKKITLPEPVISLLHRQYFGNLISLINSELFIFNPNHNLEKNVLDQIKDTVLRKNLMQALVLIKESQSNNVPHVPVDFVEKYFPEEASKIKSKPYGLVFKELYSKLKEYPLIPVIRDKRMINELLLYLNAKYKEKK